MEFLTILSMPFYFIIPLVAVLGIIIFIHELGHFLVARWCGVTVEVFSIGFGKEIVAWHDRHGTRWRLCWILLGGFVKFEGDANATSMPDGSDAQKLTPGMLQSKPVWQRMAVVAAGPIANFLLAIAIFAVVFMTFGMPDTKPLIGKVVAGSAAEKAGIVPGDLVKTVNGASIDTFPDLVKAVWDRGGEPLNFVIERGGKPIELVVTPLVKEEPDGYGGTVKKAYIGVWANSDKPIRLGPVAAVKQGVDETWFIVSATLRFLKKIVTGQESVKQIGSVGAIADGAKRSAESGLASFTFYVALISISVGILNLFPIPPLDGGQLVLYSIEAVAGKPLGAKAQEWSFRVGLSLVFMLMAIGLFNDAGRYGPVLAKFFGS
jgi:regulator of sigma E protease